MNRELLDGARNKAEEINKKMTVLEECETLHEETEDKKLCFLTEDGRVIDVSRVLDEDQLETCKNFVRIAIKSNADVAKKWLEQEVLFRPEESNSKFADGKDIEEREEIVQEKEAKELTIKNVKELLNKGMSQRAIATELGVSQGKVQRFIAQHIKKANTPS